MIEQIPNCTVYRDIDFFLSMLAVLILLYAAFEFIKKESIVKRISATLGFTIVLISLAIYHFLRNIARFYISILSDEMVTSLMLTGTLAFIAGMVIQVLFTEIDKNRHQVVESSKNKFPFPLSVAEIIGFSILIVILLLGLYDMMMILVVYIIFPFIFATDQFIKKFESLEIVKRAKPFPWFFAGISFAGFSNFLNVPLVSAVLGDYLWLIMTICILLGGLMMARGWKKVPSLTEFDWMIQM
ncbi:MAG: hypothetical protein ACFFCS_19310 [Candidatus Hodarchaeota archaeon]